MDGKIERLRERLLICSVCMDEYKDPRILPCFHSLCFDCIANVIQCSSVTGRYFRCPQCRTDICIPSGGIQKLPINFYIMSLQDELSSREYEGKCELCKGNSLPSEFRCIDCDKDICRFCIHSHRLETHVEKPQILRIERNQTALQPLPSNVLCKVHEKEKLQLFCFTCKIPICVVCSCGDHKKHHVTPLSEKLNELRSVLTKEMSKIDADVKNIVDANQLVEDLKLELTDISNRSLLALDRAATGAYDSIKKKRSALEREILESEKRQIKDLDHIKVKITTILRSMHNGYHYLVDLQETDMCLEAFESFQKFTTKLNALRKDFSSIRLDIQRNHYASSPTGYHKTPEIPVGYLRNLFYYGKLGSMRSSFLHLSVDSKTMLTELKPLGLSKKLAPYRIFFKHFVIFLFAFFLFLLAFRVCDETHLSSFVCAYMSKTFTEVNATFAKRVDAAKEYIQNLFYRDESTLSGDV